MGTRFYKKIIAGILIIVLIGSLALQSLISVSFLDVSTEGDSIDALSADFLQENFEYFNMLNYEKAQLYILANVTSSDTVEHHYAKASIALGDEEYYTALAEIQSCVALAEKESDEFTEFLIKEGCIMSMVGMYEEASRVFVDVLEIDGDNTDVLLLQTQLLVEIGDAVGAIESLETYIEIMGPIVSYYVILTQLCYEVGDYDKAIMYADEAITMEESVLEDGEFLRVFGYSLLIGQGEAETASDYLTQAIELLPEDAALYNYRGICYLTLGNMEDALLDFDRAIQLGLTSSSQYYNRGVCYINQGKLELAKADMEQVIKLNDNAELVEIAEGVIEELDVFTSY